jgi:broad specificity phosphatase PhoE
MVTKMLVVRHGHVDGIDPVRFRGRRDLPLTAIGIAQAESVGRRIGRVWRPTAIYASPLSRTVVTAEKIAQHFELVVEREPDLIDVDYGAWHGLTVGEARERWPVDVDLWCRAPQLASIPDGETLPAVFTRVATALLRIAVRHSGELVVLVAHESVNRVILLHALDLPLSHYWTIDQSPCCINEIDFVGDRFTIRRLNDTAHLE